MVSELALRVQRATIIFNKNCQYQLLSTLKPAIGGQGHRDAHGLSGKKDPRPRLWISIRTMPNDVDTL